MPQTESITWNSLDGVLWFGTWLASGVRPKPAIDSGVELLSGVDRLAALSMRKKGSAEVFRVSVSQFKNTMAHGLLRMAQAKRACKHLRTSA